MYSPFPDKYCPLLSRPIQTRAADVRVLLILIKTFLFCISFMMVFPYGSPLLLWDKELENCRTKYNDDFAYYFDTTPHFKDGLSKV